MQTSDDVIEGSVVRTNTLNNVRCNTVLLCKHLDGAGAGNVGQPYGIFQLYQLAIEQKFTTYWPDEEEIAALAPVLALGNEVLTKVESSDKSGSKRSWPVVIVGEKEVRESAPLSEMKRAIDDPYSQ